MSSSEPVKTNYLPFFIGVAFIIAALLGFAMYKYLTRDKDNNVNNVNNDNKKALSKRMNPIPSPYPSPSPSPYPSPYPSPSPSPGPSSGSCSKYEDDNGACSEDGVKAYNNALMGQMDYICRASGKQNQMEECMEMCENGQFGLPPCQSCCQSICYSMVCPPTGVNSPLPPPPRPDGKASCLMCPTICRDEKNNGYSGMYGITCDQCNKMCA